MDFGNRIASLSKKAVHDRQNCHVAHNNEHADKCLRITIREQLHNDRLRHNFQRTSQIDKIEIPMHAVL